MHGQSLSSVSFTFGQIYRHVLDCPESLYCIMKGSVKPNLSWGKLYQIIIPPFGGNYSLVTVTAWID